MTTINPAILRLDGGTQPRSTLHADWVTDYATDMAAGAEFPAIVVFFDGTDHWLADGFHRTNAALAIGAEAIKADIRQGTQRDAILYSVGANASHGHRRTNEDKRRAVLRLLDDAEWSIWSDREIARRCGVDNKTVSALRPPPPKAEAPSEEVPQIQQRAPVAQPRTVSRNGTVYQQNTANIGRRPAAPPPQPYIRPVPEPVAPAPQFDHDAAAIREAAMNAILALADQPAPQVVLDAWMKHAGYGHPVEKIERAIAWLSDFLPLYREAEPNRWASIQEKLKNVA